MKTCQECPNRNTCVKPCDKINKILKNNGINSVDFIRPKMPSHLREEGNIWREIPFFDVFNAENGHI